MAYQRLREVRRNWVLRSDLREGVGDGRRPDDLKALVIGAGIGGLGTGDSASSRWGIDVHIFESTARSIRDERSDWGWYRSVVKCRAGNAADDLVSPIGYSNPPGAGYERGAPRIPPRYGSC